MMWLRRAATLWIALAAAALSSSATAQEQTGFVEIVATHAGSSDDLRLLNDSFEPQIEITSPANGSVIAGNAVTVNGTAEDIFFDPPPDRTPLFDEVHWIARDESFVTVSSGTAPIVEGRFTIPDLVLGAGLHDIGVTAIDSAGNTGHAAVSVTSDPNAPPVTLLSPKDGEAVLTSSVTVDLNFAAPTTLVSANGVSDGRSFAAGFVEDALTVPLEVGPNVVRLELDAGGELFSASFTVFRVESVGPIRITAPADGSRTNQPEVTVTGTVPRGTPFVEVNGIPATIASDLVTFAAEVPLVERGNEIHARAFPFGQEDEVHVTLDTVPPVLDAFFPEDGTLTGEREFAFAGFLSEAGRIEAVGPGGAVAATTHTRLLTLGNEFLGIEPIVVFPFELPSLALVDGANRVDLRLVDLAGNETLESIAITRSDMALVLQSPAEGTVLPGLRTDVTLQVLADVTLESVFSAGRRVLGFDGVAIPTGPLGLSTFTLLGVPLAPGPGEIRLVYRRDATGQREVLTFELASSATEVVTVAGTVTDAATGEPLGGALVTITVNGTQIVVATADDGTYRAEVEPGDVTVTVMREGFQDVAHTVKDATVGSTVALDPTLVPWSVASQPVGEEVPPESVGGDVRPEPVAGESSADPTSLVQGTVTDASTGEPLADVEIQVEIAGEVFTTTSAADGSFLLAELPLGDFTARFSKPGFFPALFVAMSSEAVVAVLDVALDPTLLQGTVTDASTAAPLAGAEVEVEIAGQVFTTTSAADGSFLLADLPLGDFTAVISEPGFFPQRFAGKFTAPLNLGATLEPTRLQGTVTDASTSDPLADAEIKVEIAGEIFKASSAADGSFLLAGLPLGNFTALISEPGFFPQRFEGPLTAPLSLDAALEPLPDTVTVVGTTTSALTGQRESGVEVKVLGTDLVAMTDANGEYVLEGVPLGAQTVRLSKVGFLDAFSTFDDIQPQPGGAPVEKDFTFPTAQGESVALVVPPNVQGFVRDLFSAQSLAGAEVTVDGVTSVADSEGRFSLSLSPLQTFELTASSPGHEPQTLRVIVVVNGEGEVDFRLRPTTRGFVSGLVTDQTSGAPLLLADVRVEGSALLATATEGDGTYALVGVPPGSLALRVDHAAYLPATVPVIVADGEETVADIALTPRPTTGGLHGIIRDGATGSPVEGAVVSGPGGATSTTGADGAYQLFGLPGGLVTLSITAPDLPASTRTTGVVADIDASTPSLTRADFELFADGSTPDDATEDIDAAFGGVVQIPDTRFAVVFPPESLSADAQVTVRTPASPRAPPGSTLSVDPALGTEPIIAVGEEVELLISAQVEGDPPPEVVGPVGLLLRYAAGEAAAAGVDQDALFPYFFDGTRWTALHTLPYAHAVDRINKLVIVGLSFAKTETGAPVIASLATDPPIVLAQVGGGVPPFDVARQLVFHLGAAIQDLLAPNPIAEVVDLIDRFPDINANALPLLVVHGWDWRTLFQGDVDIIRDPLGAGGRYGQMIRDLVAGTDGVYRPVFLTYNSRMSVVQSGNVLAGKVGGKLLTGSIRGLPAPDDPDSGEFSSVTSFGFSMGGLVERTFQCWSGRTADMVSMGTPHHGALQQFVSGVEFAVFLASLRYPILAFVDTRTVLRHWSPGTADLLDYEDATGAGNPVLFGVNERSPCSAPQRDIGLIAGDDSLGLLGFLSVGESPNDAVVPARSAHGRSKGGRTVAALGPHIAKTPIRFFNHFEGGSASQSIGAFADQDIFTILTDWTVAKIERFDVTPPEPPDPAGSAEGEEGSVEAEVSFGFNVPHGDITGLALVLYFQDGNGSWRIAGGADPETLQAQDVAPISGNSIEETPAPENLIVRAAIPIPDPEKPETQVVDIRLLVERISKDDSRVPPEPQADFGLP